MQKAARYGNIPDIFNINDHDDDHQVLATQNMESVPNEIKSYHFPPNPSESEIRRKVRIAESRVPTPYF